MRHGTSIILYIYVRTAVASLRLFIKFDLMATRVGICNDGYPANITLSTNQNIPRYCFQLH